MGGVSIGERTVAVHIGRVRISGRSSSERSSSERSNRVGLESVTAATEFTLVGLESAAGVAVKGVAVKGATE